MGFAQPSVSLTESNTDNNLLIQLMDSKLANIDNKLTAVEQSNKDGIADLKARVDEKLADKFKQLDDRGGRIDSWLSVLGIVFAFFGILTPFGAFLFNRKIDKNIKESQTILEKETKNSIMLIENKLKKASQLLTEMKGFHRNAEIGASEIQKLANKASLGSLTPEESQKLKNDSNELKNIPENQLTANDWFIRGINALNNKEYYEAIAYYNTAIKLDCSNKLATSTYNNRGYAKFMLRSSSLDLYTEAGLDYTKAIELSPSNQYCYNNRGLVLSKLKDYKDAIKDFDKAIELDLKYVEAYFNKASVYALMKNKTEALNWLEKALQLAYPVSDVLEDEDWKNYSNDQDFKDLIAKYVKQ